MIISVSANTELRDRVFKTAVNESGRISRAVKEQLKGSVEMEEAHHITLHLVGYQDGKCKSDVAKQREEQK